MDSSAAAVLSRAVSVNKTIISLALHGEKVDAESATLFSEAFTMNKFFLLQKESTSIKGNYRSYSICFGIRL